MKHKLHPAIDTLKEEIHLHGFTYSEIVKLSGISPARFKNLMSGRTKLNVEDRDAICKVIGIEPGDVIIQRADFQESMNYVSVKHLSPELRQSIRQIINMLETQARTIERLTQKAKRRVTTKK